MTVSSGQRLGPYEILEAIGAGGMGEVYRARDRKLDRHVAIKILPEAVASDPERVARFEREARTLAALNHPNIATIHGFEESKEGQALVMELVEGPTLEDRIASGPMTVADALAVAKQIAAALDAAHEAGIVHRDLKPSNIKVREDGTVKVLDFGLAKLVMTEPSRSGAGEAMSRSPTITSPAMPFDYRSGHPEQRRGVMTGAGVILGTAAYMSPEQAKGRSADKRSDIWAFGCVLYEMLAGRRAFAADDLAETLAFVLTRDLDWTALPAETPPSIHRLLRRCLEKDRKRRLADISDAQLDIDEAVSGQGADAKPIGAAPTRDSPFSIWRLVPWSVAIAALAAASVAVWVPRNVPVAGERMHLSADLGADVRLFTDVGAAAVVSPNGSTVVFAGQNSPAPLQLYLRRLDQLQAVALPGTEGATNPFFSPDAQWVAFFAEGKLKKIALVGGAPITLADAPDGRGGTWTADGTIVFQPDKATPPQGLRLRKVPAAGGRTELLIPGPEGETSDRWPQALPGGRILFTRISRPAAAAALNFSEAELAVQSVSGGTPKTVLHGGFYGRYSPSGHLLYVHDGTVFAVRFDLARLETTGGPFPALQGVMANAATGGAQFSLSDTGIALFSPGRVDLNRVPILWMDRSGKIASLRSALADWTGILFSPDGGKLVMDIADEKTAQRDVWIYELSRDSLSRLTFDPADDVSPVWTPDGRRVAFGSKRANKRFYSLYWQPADGSGEAQLLLEKPDAHFIPGSWHPSGKYLAYHQIPQQNARDLMILPLEGSEAAGWKPGTPTVFLQTPAAEQVPMFSPDGRWIAYYSDETGRDEVYVRPFPGPGGKVQISTSGGTYATWSRTRPELFYESPDQHIMMVRYRVEGGALQPGKPVVWSDTTFSPGQFRRFALHPDGERFAVGKQLDAQGRGKAVFVFNFFDRLRRLSASQ